MPAVSFLIFCQMLGAGIGAGTAVWGQFAYVRAMRDGKLDAAERAHLIVIGHGLRYGMTLLLLASFGLVLSSYLSGAALQPALTPAYWTLVALALLIITISEGLSRKRIAFPIGSASLFAAWWFLVYLSFGWLDLSFGASVGTMVIAAGIFYGVLRYARSLAVRL